MNRPILVDTDVMVDFLRGQKKAVAFVKGNADRIALSALVVAELYAGVKGEAELEILDALVGSFRVVPVSGELAREAGLLRNKYGKSHGVGPGDAVIAATAQAEAAELATLNIKHYPMFEDLRAPYVRR